MKWTILILALWSGSTIADIQIDITNTFRVGHGETIDLSSGTYPDALIGSYYVKSPEYWLVGSALEKSVYLLYAGRKEEGVIGLFNGDCEYTERVTIPFESKACGFSIKVD
ncbi:hypothetical protein [Vibrio harveyi]|uniref:hypothetical protein n=1 Tax=Vibrio harveyi TaxID=669 RepID=UPI003D71F3BF